MANENTYKSMLESSHLSGSSSAYVDNLFEAYLKDPNSIDANWRAYFDALPPVMHVDKDVSHADIREYFLQQATHSAFSSRRAASGDASQIKKQTEVIQYINAYRSHGHHISDLDPLGLAVRKAPADLSLEQHGLTEADLSTRFHTGNFVGLEEGTLKEIQDALKETYSGKIGVEYMHITDQEQVQWLQERIEATHCKPEFSKEQKKRILEKLTAAEGLEKYLATKYVGQKRFSLEGGVSLIPLLDEIIQRGGSQNIKEMVIGMAHRGRLNVLINTLGKEAAELFQEFEGKHRDKMMSGDVKYHLGFSTNVKTPGSIVHLALSFNPSHLEIITPVVEGSVRARQRRRKDKTGKEVLPIIIHGDAAIAGQGVVMEILNMSQARGFSTGGSIHIVINNQIGFTTSNPLDSRSTLYCTDIIKMIQAPVLHVNGDDPESVVFATQIAVDFRNKFLKDVMIDLVCYRRHGHNEADEPSATQPLMYKKIKEHKRTRRIYAEQLIAEGNVTEKDPEDLVQGYREALDAGRSVVSEIVDSNPDEYAVNWHPYIGHDWRTPAKTGVPMKKLKKLADVLVELPKDFTVQPQVGKIYQARAKMTKGEIPINWGYGEALAFATLLDEGYPVRLSGQDSCRGTFAHRHAELHDQKNGETYIPLQKIAENKSEFIVIDSILSEAAVVAFEYGYATAEPNTLVMWEAQFGDFVNGAQVVIDQFISSGEQKWGRLCGLVMLLPHGYEGMGPEHSSARLERFLQLCAQRNIQVCAPTTPAQIFHLLRRQVHRPARKPLIVMTPKSLLRHKLAVSSLEDLEKGHFHPVIPEVDDVKADEITRVILCSGKVYYDLLEHRRANSHNSNAIIRLEQLYPFPDKELVSELQKYPNAKEIVWCQEEPQNQGAWFSIRHRILTCLAKGQKIRYAGRPDSASPAVGYLALHMEQQAALVKDALE